MLAQQQNPRVVSHSLQQQQIDSKEINIEGEADVKTFSIRQYAFTYRQRSLVQSWPFPEKYLQMCLDSGLRNVLPPFGLRNIINSSVSESSSQNGMIPNLNDPCDQEDYDDDKNVGFLKSESSPDHPHQYLHDELKNQNNIMKHSDYSGLLMSNEERSKAMMISSAPDCVNKSSQILNCSSKSSSGKSDRRRRGGRCKKRSMADILAVAKRCSLEEIHRINQFSYAATGNIIEGYSHDETAPLDENDREKSSERDDDHEAAKFDMLM